jgi:hypothetical protein
MNCRYYIIYYVKNKYKKNYITSLIKNKIKMKKLGFLLNIYVAI